MANWLTGTFRVIENRWQLIAPFAASAFLLLKLAAVSHYSFTTATALVSSVGIVEVLVGSFLVALKTGVFFAGLFVVTWRSSEGGSRLGLWSGVALVVLGLGIYQPPSRAVGFLAAFAGSLA